jgi:hypothetical protein
MHNVRPRGGPATHQADPNDDALVSRVRAEFLEMPGLQLTPAQATRLWGLEPAACERVIDALVECDFLRWTSAGTIARAE